MKHFLAWAGRHLRWAVMATAIAVPVAPVQATVISGTSNAYDVMVDLTVTPLIGSPSNISVSPLAEASGVAPPPYDNSDTVLGVSTTLGSLGSIGADILSASAISDVDGGSGNRVASATSSIAGAFLFDLASAELINSSATVSGDYNSFATNGGTTLLNASILGMDLPVEPAPNTDLLALFGLDSLTGVSAILNEQIEGGDGVSSRSFEVNALHIAFTNAPFGTGLLNGDIIIGHSYAELNAAPAAEVPEPAGPVLLALGLTVLLALGAARSRVRTSGLT